MATWGTRLLGAVGAVVAVMLVASLTVAAPGTVLAQQDGFSDVEPGSHKPAIDALNAMGLFEGTECGARRVLSQRPRETLDGGRVVGAGPRRRGTARSQRVEVR